jgi:PAS domain-containing protein
MENEKKTKKELIEELKELRLQSGKLGKRVSRDPRHGKDELQHKLGEEAETEDMYRSFFENAQGGMFRSTFQGRFLMVNLAFARGA